MGLKQVVHSIYTKYRPNLINYIAARQRGTPYLKTFKIMLNYSYIERNIVV